MSKKLYEENNIRDIASAIREQNGTQDSYTVAQMGSAIRAIKTQPDLEVLNATENGNYLPSSGKDGFSSVSVNVESGKAVVQPLSVTQNGTYNPPSGVDGFAPVMVNVSSGGDDSFALTNYIESSGTQYIDTDYVPKSNTTVEMVAQIKAINAYQIWFGCRYAASSRQFWLDRSSSNSYFNDGHGSTITTLIGSSNFSKYSEKKVLIKKSNIGAFIRLESIYDSAAYSHSNDFTEIGCPIYLFAINTNGSASSFGHIKLYRFRILEDDALVHEFIPWQENGVACLKDTVTGSLLYNAGTGDFVYGTDS